MGHVRLQSDNVTQAFTNTFIKTFQSALCIAGYVLLAATFISIMTPEETIIRGMLDGSIMRPLAWGLLGIVVLSAARGLIRAVLTAFHTKATLTVFRSSRYKY